MSSQEEGGESLNDETAVGAAVATPSRKDARRRLSLTVAVRQPTPQEGRQFDAALNLLLTELLRQRIDLGRDGVGHE